MERCAADDDPAANTGANRDVERRIVTLRGTPAVLGEGGPVDIGIHGYGRLQTGSDRGDDRRAAPARLRCRQHVAVPWRLPVQLNRTKGGDANGREWLPSLLGGIEQEPAHPGQGLPGCRRRDARGGEAVRWTAAHRTDKLRAAAFYRPIQCHRSPRTPQGIMSGSGPHPPAPSPHMWRGGVGRRRSGVRRALAATYGTHSTGHRPGQLEAGGTVR